MSRGTPESLPYQRASQPRLTVEGRVPPHDLHAERAVLGGILLQNEALNVVLEILSAECFYSEANATIYRAMEALFAAGQPVDSVTLRDSLATSSKLQMVGGDEYILSLTQTIPTIANIEAHARIVREKHVVRQLITTCYEVAAKGYGDYGEMEEYLDTAERLVFGVAKQRARNPYEHINQIVTRTFEEITAAAERKEAITGLPTGFTRLDHMTAGMHPGDLIIIAGRPGMGKTSFALNVALNACQGRNVPVAVFSLEMPKEQLARRMLCSEARVDAAALRSGHLTREDWPKLINAAGVLSEFPIWIDDTPGLTLMELRSKTRRIQSEHGLGLVVIDYLQLMRAGARTDSREQEISEISRSLKGLAKELGLPVIALSQLNRGVENRTGSKKPQISDLRESGAIEQDADTIMFIYRDEVYNKDSPDNRGIAEIIVGKQRHGPTGEVKCRFFHEYTRFENLADEYYDSMDGAY